MKNMAIGRWALAILVGLIFLFPSNSAAQENCPEGYICIDESEKDRYRRILENQKCLNDSIEDIRNKGYSDDFDLSFDPYPIVVTYDGQVFTKGHMTGTLEWCSYELDLKMASNTRVEMSRYAPDEKRWGWRLRVRLGALFDPVGLGQGRNFQASLEPALALEPFFYKKAHLSTHFGLRTFGLGLGFDLTRNMDVYGAVATRWTEPSVIIPVIGVTLSIN